MNSFWSGLPLLCLFFVHLLFFNHLPLCDPLLSLVYNHHHPTYLCRQNVYLHADVQLTRVVRMAVTGVVIMWSVFMWSFNTCTILLLSPSRCFLTLFGILCIVIFSFVPPFGCLSLLLIFKFFSFLVAFWYSRSLAHCFLLIGTTILVLGATLVLYNT